MLVLGDGMPEHWERALRRNGQLAVDLILCVQKWHFEPQNVPDPRDESVKPIVEEAEEKIEMKKGEEGHEAGMANGVEHEDEAEEEGEEVQEEEVKEAAVEDDGAEDEGGEEEEQGEEEQ
ncbi:hypothetical protein LTR53_019440, partial [Teratosphaeriaceae sp. CCFEE 6253]